MSEESSEITVQRYSDKSVLVQGDYDTHAKTMKRFHARWNPRLKGGAGWLVPLEFESAVRSYFGVEEEEELAASQKYRPSPKKAATKPPPAPVAEEEEAPTEEEPSLIRGVSKAPAVASKAPVSKAPVVTIHPSKVPASKVPAKATTVNVDTEDVVSLANRMKEMMFRIEKLEAR